MSTLKEKADVLREQLGLTKDLKVAEVVEKSVEQLGLAEQTSGLALVGKADECLKCLGVEVSSGAATSSGMSWPWSSDTGPPMDMPVVTATVVDTAAEARMHEAEERARQVGPGGGAGQRCSQYECARRRRRSVSVSTSCPATAVVIEQRVADRASEAMQVLRPHEPHAE